MIWRSCRCASVSSVARSILPISVTWSPAVNVRAALGLDRVLFVVANIPWQKAGRRPISPAADRLALVTEAVRGLEGIEPSAIEIERGGDSVTADTLETLRARDPGVELYVILGADAAAGLPTWRRPDVVRALATIVAVSRPGTPTCPPLPGWRWEEVEVPRLDVSSSGPARTGGQRAAARRSGTAGGHRSDPGAAPVRARRMTGPGRHRRTRLDTRPRRTALVAVLSVAVVGAVPVLVWKGARTIVDSNEGSTVTVRAVPAAQIPPTPVGMLVIVGGDGRASAMVLISQLPKGEGGFVIQVPADTRVDIPGIGDERIATAYDTGGLDLAQQTMQAALQITIDVAAEANASQLADLLAAYEPFAVHFDQPVLTSTSDGRTDTVFPAGDAALAATDVPKLLFARLADEVETDVLARQEALWRAVIAAVKAKPGKADSTDIAGFIGGLGQGTYSPRRWPSTLRGSGDGLPGIPPDVDPDAVARRPGHAGRGVTQQFDHHATKSSTRRGIRCWPSIWLVASRISGPTSSPRAIRLRR